MPSAPSVAAPQQQPAQEAQIFRTFLQLRRQQRTKVLAEAQHEADTSSASEAALVFALDRAQFLAEQLQHFGELSAGGESQPTSGWNREDWKKRFAASEERLERRWKLREDLSEQRSQAQLALRRLRALVSLCELSHCQGIEGSPDSDSKGHCDDLASILRNCEAVLLSTAKRCPAAHASLEEQPTSGSDVFLDSVLSLLLKGEHLEAIKDDASSKRDVVDRTPSPAAPSDSPVVAEEEASLRRLLQDLTHHNEELKRELQEKRTKEARAAERKAKEEEVMLTASVLRRALAEGYEDLAKWHQEDLHAAASAAAAASQQKQVATLETFDGRERQDFRAQPESQSQDVQMVRLHRGVRSLDARLPRGF
eukprot:TRINITY_DN102095_c0_g1_i1.p1 TRINITY_DN102095_c0_g1~~TRINITY_DN102095_c0_g1_i1.p1  ORF type:complete len:367 (-),score=100.73 TRINITY_DN102095_c0_g1_i1:63-1163(-)